MTNTAPATNAFSAWIDTFIAEKDIDTATVIETEGRSGTNFMTAANVIEAMKATGTAEQAQIKTTFVKIDFANGDPMHFIRHMAGAIAI